MIKVEWDLVWFLTGLAAGLALGLFVVWRTLAVNADTINDLKRELKNAREGQ